MSQLLELLEELDFESWLDYEGIAYKLTRGTNGLQANIRECPCCGNTKWKVYFGLESGLGNCFVCEQKFSKWKFIQSHLNLSGAGTFDHIKSFMANQGWRPKTAAHSAPVEKPKLVIPDSLPLPINGRNLRYLSERGVDAKTAQEFELRYSKDGKFNYVDAYGKPQEQDYSSRIIIPVRNMDGRLVSFQGRDITGTALKKYLFPPEFSATGSILYNAHKAKGKARVVMGEGVFDCIAIHMAIQGDAMLRHDSVAIASFGKHLAHDQLLRLKELQAQGLEEVIFMWDAESAAMSRAVESALECRKHGLASSVAMLPVGCDPNEVPADVVQDAIWNAVPVTPTNAIKLKLEARRL